MNKEAITFSNYLKIALLFAFSFALFAIVCRILQTDNLNQAVKLLITGAYGIFVLKVFRWNVLINFAGFCVLMYGLNYIMQDEATGSLFKIAATVAVLLQFGTLTDTRQDKINEPHAKHK